MRLGGLARSCTCVAVVAGLAGCGTTSNSTTTATVIGGKLTVYASVPSQASDVFDGEQLALKQTSQTGKYQVALKRLTADTTAQITNNARTADNDKSTIAYLGEVVPGTSGSSVPITNELGILQVSPTDSALELTEGSSILPNTRKALFYPSESTYGYTFARVVPSAAVEAKALVAEMQALKVTKLYVTSDPSPCTDVDVSGCYGKAIANAVAQDAPAKSITVQHTASGADGAFVGTNSPAFGAKTFATLAAANPALKLFGGSPLDTPAFASALGSGPQANVYISSPGLPRIPASFATRFRGAYGQAPTWQAVFGYLAMTAVLDALQQAGSLAANRTTVINDFFGRSRQSVLGSFTITQAGDIQLPTPTIVINRFRSGQLVAFRSAPTG